MLKTIQKLKTFSFNKQGFSVLFSYRKKLTFVDKKEINDHEVSTLSEILQKYMYLHLFKIKSS